MGNTVTVNARIEPDLKKEVHSIFKSMGISASQAITMFYNMVKLKRGIPFEEKLPNKVTLKAIDEIEKGRGVKRFDTPEELFEDLGI